MPGVAAGAVGRGNGQPNATKPSSTVRLELLADGFVAPVGLEVAPGDDQHYYVVDQVGTVHEVGPDGVREEPFLDVTDEMVTLSGYEERGLLGLAFHPEFQSTRRCYVRYSAPPREGTPSGYDHTFVLSEFTVDANRRADPASERALLELPEPQSNHNSGAIAFGPDGYLYVGTGDGGAANDTGTGHVEDWYGENSGGNGQDVTENLLGSILRIDVDGRTDGNPYGIPDDNPLVDRPGLDEHWAWGFRNPWRMSFTGDELFAADVGQNRYEEIDLVERGGNYGWNVREGAHCFGTSAPSSPPDSCPDTAPDAAPYDGQPLFDPIVEYPHQSDTEPNGIAVIGGFLARESGVPALDDRYVFGDWRWGRRLFAASRQNDGGQWPVETVGVESSDGSVGQYLLAFGRDTRGRLYVLTTDSGGPAGTSGAVHRIRPGGQGSAGGNGQTTRADLTGSTTTGGQPGFGVLAALGATGVALGVEAVRSDMPERQT